jgi:hypothetical protein
METEEDKVRIQKSKKKVDIVLMGKWKIVVRNGENRMICQKSWRHQYLHLQSDARVIN